jgi:probable HAF family extracellular repeat protein
MDKPHAVLWADGTMTDLGTLGGAESNALAINDAGQLAGAAETATGAWHAVLWAGGAPTDLGTLGGSRSAALALNNAGQVAGWAATGLGGATPTP